MPGLIHNITFSPGYITLHRDAGPPQKYAIDNIIRLLDIPVGLTQTQVAGLTTLANFFTIVIRVLIERDILNEEFVDSLGMDWDLNHLIYAIESLGGSYDSPSLDTVVDA